jgi:hypothetical protein
LVQLFQRSANLQRFFVRRRLDFLDNDHLSFTVSVGGRLDRKDVGAFRVDIPCIVVVEIIEARPSRVPLCSISIAIEGLMMRR